MRTLKQTRRRAALVAVAAVAAIALLAPVGGPAGAADTRTDATHLGARWVAEQFTEAGYIPDPTGQPAPTNTAQSALALAAAGTEEGTFDAAMAWLEANAEAYVSPGANDDPAALGYLLLLTDAAGADPTSFGGLDLVARLGATLGASGTTGLYGAGDPTFDGVFRQSIAILGLVASGATVPAAAVDWLHGQQCGATSPVGARGGWEPFRADPTPPCALPDIVNFTGPETNSTAMAVQALEAVDQAPAQDPLDFLATAQGPDGGFPFLTGLDVDPNSTALVLQALAAAGADPSGAPWAKPGGTPISSLLAWQIGCAGEDGDVGGFASAFSDGFPDQMASQQAVWGVAGSPFPLGPVTFADPADPCGSSPTTTSTSTVPSTSVPSTTVVGSPSPVVAPRFAG